MNDAQNTTPGDTGGEPGPATAAQERSLRSITIASLLAVTLSLAAAPLYFHADDVAPGDRISSQTAPKLGSDGRLPLMNSEAAGRDAMYGWGGVLLVPSETMTNTAGRASAYAFAAEGVDRERVTATLARAVGVDGAVHVDDSGAASVQSGDGGYVWVGTDSLASFSASSQARSPWNCAASTPGAAEPQPMPERDTDASSTASVGVATSNSGTAPLPTSAGESAAVPPKGEPDKMAEYCTEGGELPSKADATRTVTSLFAKLGLDTAEAKFVTTVSAYSISVAAYPVVDGQRIANAWVGEVSAEGVFSVSGYSARIEKIGEYDTIGARDAVLRSADPRWSALGPVQVGQGQVYPLYGRDAVSSTVEPATTQPVSEVRTVDGVPVIAAQYNQATVDEPSAGLRQHWLGDGRLVLLPTWECVSEDGAVWSVLAIADRYVELTNLR